MRASRLNNFDNDSNVNLNDRQLDNQRHVRGIAQTRWFPMQRPRSLYQCLCSYDNLFLAYKKARKGKTQKPYVLQFEKNLEQNLLQLRTELLFHSYKPKPLVNFIIRDPKTRKISKSDFRDRVVHHALCNIIEPIFDKGFIYDSFANRIGKGALNALKRFDVFKKKVSRNNTRACYIFKADIQKYFESINHAILVNIVKQKIKDSGVIWLIKQILRNCAGGGAIYSRDASRKSHQPILC